MVDAGAADRGARRGSDRPERLRSQEDEPVAPLPGAQRRAARPACWSRPSPWCARRAGGSSACGTSTCSCWAARRCIIDSIVEMQTGEGKTLTATLPLYLAALEGKGAHLATVNDYLAQRDAEWMRPLYEAAGHDGRLHPEPDAAARAAQSIRLRRHLRHGQRDGLRLPPRSAAQAADQRGAARPVRRDARPGRQRATRSRCRASCTSCWSTRPTAFSSTRPARR